MTKFGVYIGRLQPLHNAHLAAIRMALLKVDQLVIVLGSACQAKTIKNPWTTDEREHMVRACLTEYENARTTIVSAKDYYYNDNFWLSALQSAISRVINIDDENVDVTLFGHDKDRSTFYLHLFPMWKFEDTGTLGDIDATRVRDVFFTELQRENKQVLKEMVPGPVYNILINEIDNSDKYLELVKEYNHIVDYKKMWSVSPYPPTFVTTDAVLIQNGHVLVVKRNGYPGRGLLALPGGFLNQNERIIDGCLRELEEETGICIPKDELKKRIVDQRVFDHPDRSLRGRTISHAFCFNLEAGKLPKVKGADDAEKAFWMPLRDVMRNEESFFEDHFAIIYYFSNKF